MILTLTLDREEFTAKRRKAQTDYEEALRPAIQQALEDGDWAPVIVAVEALYLKAYTEETGDLDPLPMPKGWAQQFEDTLEKTKGDDEATEDRIALWLASALLNIAAIEASQNDPEELLLEWVTMHDEDVRGSHVRTDGQQRPRGVKFDVDTVEMEFPGDSRVPIEYWINCRCTLRPVLAEQAEFALGGAVKKNESDLMAAVEEAELPEEPLPEEATAVPWHGVLAPEGIASGDGRKFAEESLRFRPLPLPLTWQKISDDGHKGNVTVARIDRIERVGSEMRSSGVMLSTAEADEVMGLLAEFGKFGVSIDADDSTFEVDEEAEEVIFTSARISSACIVPIPAFAEAWVGLGDAPEDFFNEGTEVEVDATEDSLAASGMLARFKDLAPGKTEDGPGWLTHPVDTDRLRDYWVRGAGAAKINWGVPGDFNRCRIAVAEYVKPQYLNGYCANRHYDALGVWPGRPLAGESTQFAAEKMGTSDEPAEALSMTAAGGFCAPSEWFENPNLTEPTPLTVTDDGRVFGHIAEWSTCHIGVGDACVSAPHSNTDYAYFASGEVALDNGTRARVGQITIGGGHADGRLGVRPALAHYDSTSAVAADVAVGEDQFGIWFAGWVRPGVSDEVVTALRASALSGDWRKVAGNLELVAALAVNVPGFGIPRARVAASSQGQMSLVASGVVAPSAKTKAKFANVDIEALAAAVARQMVEVQVRKEKMAALAARVNGSN